MENEYRCHTMMNYKEILPCPGLIFRQTGDVAGKQDTCFSHNLFLYGQPTRHTEQVTTGKFRTIGV